MKSIGFLLFLLVFGMAFKSDKPAYLLYDSKGNKVSFAKMISELGKKQLLMFGELHNNPIAHWLQLETTRELGKKKDLILGAEMFEADNQNELDWYLSDSINAHEFDSLAGLWQNFKTDYKPLVDYAKENELPFIATNIPRRFAAEVHKNGGFKALDSLSAKEKAWVAPLPIPFDPEVPSYKAIAQMMASHGTPDLVKAQASKDATMAHFILKNYQSGKTFIHYNGAYHSNDYEGILWYIQKQKPQMTIGTITTVNQTDVQKLKKENKGKADFIIVVDEDMTTTF